MSLSVAWACGKSAWDEIDAYVQAHPHSCFGHTAAWRRAVWAAYRLPCLPLVARRAGALVGVVPWTLMVSPAVGPYLVVAPFASYGDLLADDDGVRTELLAATAHRLPRLLLAYAQVRSRLAPPPVAPGTTTRSDRFVTSLLPLGRDPDAVWSGGLDAKARNQVRKAERDGVRVERVSPRQTRGWEAFLSVCALGARSLGSPFHGRAFFDALVQAFGDRVAVWVASTASDEPAAAALAVSHRTEWHYVYGQNVHELRATSANVLLVWRMLEAGCAAGAAAADLGRSERGSPSERFKRHFGATAHPLTESYVAGLRRSMPDLNPTNPGFARVQSAWRRLPLVATQALSPLLMRGIG